MHFMLRRKVLVAQLWLTLCDSLGYTVHGILQDRMLELVALSFSRESSQPRDRTQSPILQADSLLSEPPGKPMSNKCENTEWNINISLDLYQNSFLRTSSDVSLCHWLVGNSRITISPIFFQFVSDNTGRSVAAERFKSSGEKYLALECEGKEH